MRWVYALLACTGCSSILGIDNFKLVDAGTPGDATDAAIDAPLGVTCLGPTAFSVCFMNPTASVPLPAAINTDTGSLCLGTQPQSWKQAGQADACFILGTTISVDTLVATTGSRPLVLVATDAINVNMTIDVAAHFTPIGSPVMRPPGSPSSDCGSAGAGVDNTNGAGGGGGGSFTSRGGGGGEGDGGQAPGGVFGTLTGVPTKLRAGCSGGNGGRGQGGIQGAAGVGGGAIYVVAANRILISGLINASGSAGDVGGPFSGGAGAGSGGMIMLHAPVISGGGILIANGGGGAGGSASNLGARGQDPNPMAPNQPAQGGPGTPAPGGNGFAGGALAMAGGPGSLDRGGGGGGGGGGYIRANVANPTLVASPVVTLVP